MSNAELHVSREELATKQRPSPNHSLKYQRRRHLFYVHYYPESSNNYYEIATIYLKDSVTLPPLRLGVFVSFACQIFSKGWTLPPPSPGRKVWIRA